MSDVCCCFLLLIVWQVFMEWLALTGWFWVLRLIHVPVIIMLLVGSSNIFVTFVAFWKFNNMTMEINILFLDECQSATYLLFQSISFWWEDGWLTDGRLTHGWTSKMTAYYMDWFFVILNVLQNDVTRILLVTPALYVFNNINSWHWQYDCLTERCLVRNCASHISCECVWPIIIAIK